MTDPYSKVTTKITKVTGSLARSKDNNGYYVNFNHDAFGSVLSVTDSLSNTLRTQVYAYGIKPFRTSWTDMDLGSRSFTVDALGEITAYSDGMPQNFSATYDALARMTSRTEPDLTTTWTWGTTAASYNIGKLASVSSVASAGTHTDSYTYDSAGRLLDHTIVNPGDGSRSFDYAYDTTTGLLTSLTYPFSYPSTLRVKVGYAYQNGILQQIIDSSTSTVWWQANTMNPRGQITQETAQALSTDPQIVATRTYDAVTGWLGSIQAGVSGGSALQNQAYLYDENGNVTQRQDNNLGLTENFYYDNLYRLDHSTLGGSTNLQMGYDAMGDITSRSDVAGGATWTYDPVRKHAVTQAGSSAYTYAYNANGNATSRNGSTIGWTSYNHPSGVGTSTESATFDYGPDRQRWRMVYTGSAGVETTYYATPMFEVVHTSSLTDYRHYIFAGGRAVMQLARSVSGANQRPLLTDHQGSISTIMHGTGTSFVNESFTAYGKRREASTWTGSPTSTELTNMNSITRQGYTFQTVLGSMGLNHMNGRVEDSVTGRFLSADPHVYGRSNTQSFNRYSYVNNNPLSATDPTGFRIVPCVDNCNVPAGFGNLPPRLQQLLFAGQTNYVSDHPNSFNTGQGSLFGLVTNDFTGASGLPGADNADLANGFQPDPTEVTIASSARAPSSGSGDAAQGTDSNSSLDYIQITATKLSFDPTTGTVSVIVNAGGTGGGFTPFANSANSASFDSERAIDAFNNASQAYAAGDLGEYGRQMDLYYKYSGCSCGPVYLNNPQTAGPLSPTGPPGVQIPPLQIPPIQIFPPEPISP